MSAYAFNVANLAGEAAPEQIQIARASANFFRLCAADVVRGRTYTAEEDLPHASKTAVRTESASVDPSLVLYGC